MSISMRYAFERSLGNHMIAPTWHLDHRAYRLSELGIEEAGSLLLHMNMTPDVDREIRSEKKAPRCCK